MSSPGNNSHKCFTYYLYYTETITCLWSCNNCYLNRSFHGLGCLLAEILFQTRSYNSTLQLPSLFYLGMPPELWLDLPREPECRGPHTLWSSWWGHRKHMPKTEQTFLDLCQFNIFLKLSWKHSILPVSVHNEANRKTSDVVAAILRNSFSSEHLKKKNKAFSVFNTNLVAMLVTQIILGSYQILGKKDFACYIAQSSCRCLFGMVWESLVAEHNDIFVFVLIIFNSFATKVGLPLPLA